MQTHRIEVSYKTIVFTVIFLLSLWLVYQIRSVIVALFIALILMSALNPLIRKMEKRKIPRGLAIILTFVLIILTVTGIVASVVPPFIDQTRSLVNQIPAIIDRLQGFPIDQQVIGNQFGSVPGNITRFVIGTFSNLVALVTLFVLTFYLLSERGNLHRYLSVFFDSSKTESKAEDFINQLEVEIGGWVRGQLTLMIIIGTMTYVGLRILGISFALPLAIFAGLLEIIPNIGPVVSAVPAVLIALTVSPVTALATAALYFLIQQFENTIIVPKVMQKATGVKPLVTIVCLMIGLKLAGVLGAILAIPGYLIIKIIIGQLSNSVRFQRNTAK
jgi:predicted PurR-regulated permease PerM